MDRDRRVAFGEALSGAETSRERSTAGMGARRERIAEILDRVKADIPHLRRSDDDQSRQVFARRAGAEIEAMLNRAAGNEIAKGNFDSPESSACLAANAFGFFLRPGFQPPLLLGRSAGVAACED